MEETVRCHFNSRGMFHEEPNQKSFEKSVEFGRSLLKRYLKFRALTESGFKRLYFRLPTNLSILVMIDQLLMKRKRLPAETKQKRHD